MNRGFDEVFRASRAVRSFVRQIPLCLLSPSFLAPVGDESELASLSTTGHLPPRQNGDIFMVCTAGELKLFLTRGRFSTGCVYALQYVLLEQ